MGSHDIQNIEVQATVRRAWQTPMVITETLDETNGPIASNTDEKPFDDFGS